MSGDRKSENVKLPPLPAGWVWTTIGQLLRLGIRRFLATQTVCFALFFPGSRQLSGCAQTVELGVMSGRRGVAADCRNFGARPKWWTSSSFMAVPTLLPPAQLFRFICERNAL